MTVDVDMMKDLIPYVVPAVIAFFGVTLGPAFITTRRVRQDLAADTELLARLQPGSKEHTELAEAVQSRTLHLVSMIHYPAATRLDVLAWLGTVSCSAVATAWAIVSTQPALRPFTTLDSLTSGFPVGLGPVSVVSAWMGFQHPWSKRAVSRVRYVRAHLGLEEAMETYRSLRLAEKASFIVAMVLTIYTLAVVTVACLSMPDAVPAFVGVCAVMAVAIAGACFLATRHRFGLNKVLPSLLKADIAADEARAAEEAERAAVARRATVATAQRQPTWRRLSAAMVGMLLLDRRGG
ncbi:hypothetical protein GCM10009817_30790 [Terrabacter lapilli]|uniref:Uncharacterized protein n=1 Tax=Terrabacter lapilli TaxID=436231 RepID=A0ABP5DYT3_9MICO